MDFVVIFVANLIFDCLYQSYLGWHHVLIAKVLSMLRANASESGLRE
ncbi:hypothetical protein MED121_04203 [Marinomonas sp. MED121]|nr:hypothetical protein MED121_04203 [Marinomonas sp. MED121]